MEAKFTPGPWHVSASGPTVYALHGEPLRNRFTALVQAGRRDDAGCAELRANARLMAAAPTLAKALTKLMQHFPTDGDMHEAGWTMDEINAACDAHDAARAALAKAGLEGEQG